MHFARERMFCSVYVGRSEETKTLSLLKYYSLRPYLFDVLGVFHFPTIVVVLSNQERETFHAVQSLHGPNLMVAVSQAC
jgi:hypothetical protein